MPQTIDSIIEAKAKNRLEGSARNSTRKLRLKIRLLADNQLAADAKTALLAKLDEVEKAYVEAKLPAYTDSLKLRVVETGIELHKLATHVAGIEAQRSAVSKRI